MPGHLLQSQHMIEANQPILSVQDLNFSFEKDKHILKGLSFTIEKGSFTLITGPNGSGKSLLLRCLKGLLQPNTGTIQLFDEDLTHKAKQRMQAIGLVFQDAETQIVGQTVEKDIRFGMENLGLSKEVQENRLEEVLTLLDLHKQRDQRPRTLSGGEKRRLAIAGVLVMDPKLLVLDEPFANLDYRSVVSVLSTLLNLQQEGHTIILVSHEVEKTLAHADHVLLLDDGLLVQSGTAADVYPHLKGHGIYLPSSLAIKDLSWLKP